jgi:copper chaperone CopZ
MKKILLFALAAFALQTATAGTTDSLTVKIEDMHCRKCSDRITKQISTLEGIQFTKPRLGNHTFFVRFDSDKTNRAEIVNTITKGGYTPVGYCEKSDNIYFLIPAEQATQETIDAVKAIEGVKDANTNAGRKSLAVTFNKETISAEALQAALQQKGIQATLPKPHVCDEEKEKK